MEILSLITGSAPIILGGLIGLIIGIAPIIKDSAKDNWRKNLESKLDLE